MLTHRALLYLTGRGTPGEEKFSKNTKSGKGEMMGTNRLKDALSDIAKLAESLVKAIPPKAAIFRVAKDLAAKAALASTIAAESPASKNKEDKSPDPTAGPRKKKRLKQRHSKLRKVLRSLEAGEMKPAIEYFSRRADRLRWHKSVQIVDALKAGDKSGAVEYCNDKILAVGRLMKGQPGLPSMTVLQLWEMDQAKLRKTIERQNTVLMALEKGESAAAVEYLTQRIQGLTLQLSAIDRLIALHRGTQLVNPG